MEIIGHQKQWQFLKESLVSGKISHAYLFSGQEKLGKRTIALEFAKLLLERDIINSSHPDFIYIEPEKKEIRINQIRELIWRISLKPVLSSMKVAIIDQVHTMNIEAQNCFLKTLEEPKGNSLLILITSFPELLLPTILSRCEILKFYPLKEEEIDNWLKSWHLIMMSEEERKEITRFSLGRPGLAFELTSNPQKLSYYKKHIRDLIKILDSDLSFRFGYARETAKHSLNLREILESWLNFLHLVLLEKISQEQKRSSLSFSLKLPLPVLKNALEEIQNIIFLISTTNVNPRLSLEYLMLKL